MLHVSYPMDLAGIQVQAQREREKERDMGREMGWGGRGCGAKACRQTDRRRANELYANHSALPATVIFVIFFGNQ